MEGGVEGVALMGSVMHRLWARHVRGCVGRGASTGQHCARQVARALLVLPLEPKSNMSTTSPRPSSDLTRARLCLRRVKLCKAR